jgi:hypothetical protein
MSLFDSLRAGMFNTLLVNNGRDASWIPGVGQDPVTGKILKKEFTEYYEENGVEHSRFSYLFEFQPPHFPGLFEATQAGTFPVITVDGISYNLRAAEARFTGFIYQIVGNKI